MTAPTTFRPAPGERGFAALGTVLALAAAAASLSLLAAATLLVAQDAIGGEQAYARALEAARGCAQYASERLASYPDRFSSPVRIPIFDSDSCVVIAASTTEDVAGIQTVGISGTRSVWVYASATRNPESSAFVLRTWRKD